MKGQTAIEYLLMISIILTILTFLTYYAQDMTESNRQDIMVSNAMIAVNKIAEAANIVYTQGEPSQITLSIYIPENLQSIQIGNKTPGDFPNKMVLMRVNVGSGVTDVFAYSKAPLQGNISTDFGTKNIIVKAEGNYVNVTQG